MTSTPNFNLFKPSGEDYVNPKLDIADQMTKLDQELNGQFRYSIVSGGVTAQNLRNDGALYIKPQGTKAYDTTTGGIFTGIVTGTAYGETEGTPGVWTYMDSTNFFTGGWQGYGNNADPYVMYSEYNGGTAVRVRFRGRVQLNLLDALANNTTYTMINVARDFLPQRIKYFNVSCGMGTGNTPRTARVRVDSTSMQVFFMGGTPPAGGSVENYVDLSRVYYDRDFT